MVRSDALIVRLPADLSRSPFLLLRHCEGTAPHRFTTKARPHRHVGRAWVEPVVERYPRELRHATLRRRNQTAI